MAERESIVTRVQKLLALAMDERTPEAERLLAQQKADNLMLQNMIDQAELAVDDPNRSRVTSAQWLFNFESEFAFSMESLLRAIMNHTSCSHHVEYKYVSATATEQATNRFVYVTGTAENIAYAERLWMVVFNDLVLHMFPRVDPTNSFDANVYHLVKAGFKWKDIHETLWAHKDDPRWLEWPLNDPYPAPAKYSWQKPEYAGDGGRLKRAYRRELKRLGEPVESHTSRHGAYRRSYVDAYVSTINSRLWRMRNEAQKVARNSDTYVSNDRFALVLLEAKDAADAKLWEAYPDKHPEAIKARMAELDRVHEERVAEEKARWDAMSEEERAKARRKQEREERANEKYWEEQRRKNTDHHGATRGRKVAEKVNLNNHSKVSGESRQSVSNRRELS